MSGIVSCKFMQAVETLYVTDSKLVHKTEIGK